MSAECFSERGVKKGNEEKIKEKKTSPQSFHAPEPSLPERPAGFTDPLPLPSPSYEADRIYRSRQ